jgi:hypothetical protein
MNLATQYESNSQGMYLIIKVGDRAKVLFHQHE